MTRCIMGSVFSDYQEGPAPAGLSLGVTQSFGRHLFTGVRGIRILGSSLAGSWIKPRNTPPRWPWAGPIRAQGGEYYLRLDAYASIWMLLADASSCPRHPARQT